MKVESVMAQAVCCGLGCINRTAQKRRTVIHTLKALMVPGHSLIEKKKKQGHVNNEQAICHIDSMSMTDVLKQWNSMKSPSCSSVLLQHIYYTYTYVIAGRKSKISSLNKTVRGSMEVQVSKLEGVGDHLLRSLGLQARKKKKPECK